MLWASNPGGGGGSPRGDAKAGGREGGREGGRQGRREREKRREGDRGQRERSQVLFPSLARWHQNIWYPAAPELLEIAALMAHNSFSLLSNHRSF